MYLAEFVYRLCTEDQYQFYSDNKERILWSYTNLQHMVSSSHYDDTGDSVLYALLFYMKHMKKSPLSFD
jgi:hypothetical protein